MVEPNSNSISFRRDAFYERSHFFVPGNYVVVMFRVLGVIDKESLQNALIELRICHPMLGVHIEFDQESKAWFVAEGTPPCQLKEIPRITDDSWYQAVFAEYAIPFDVHHGPLIRFLWIHDREKSELIAFAQHSICDGLSLTYLLKDLMQKLGNPSSALVPKTYIPTFREIYDLDSIKINWLVKKVLTKFNTAWKQMNLSLNEDDFRPLHTAFASSNLKLLTWSLEPEITQQLVARCHQEKVSVNSALYCAILNTQYKLQGDHDIFRRNIMMPVNIRNYVNPPIGEAVGLFAGGESFSIKMNWKNPFWKQARQIHQEFQKRMTPTYVFTHAKKLTMLEPNLMEGRAFLFLGKLTPEATPKYQEMMALLEKDRLLAKMKKKVLQTQLQMGSLLTNLGVASIPEKYGNLLLDQIYLLPPVSPFAEKLIGVVTYKNRLQGSIAYAEKNLNSALANQFATELVNLIKMSIKN